eukprot:c5333_g1_i2.p1 GENE.c5333_g1_i2~~c5333_g1_i2.p1  ORF type:complete len:205 (+),score=40.44 c5333_g1_i2:41-655(+)
MSTTTDLEINWNNWNIPPCFPVYHFDLGELTGARRRGSFLYLTMYQILLAYLVTNLVTSVTLAANGIGIFRVFYSIFNLIIGTIIGFQLFYGGYEGLAKKSHSQVGKYMNAHRVMLVVVAFLALGPPFSSFNPFWRIITAQDTSSAAFWTTMCVVESCELLLYIAIGAYTIHYVSMYRATLEPDTFGDLLKPVQLAAAVGTNLR